MNIRNLIGFILSPVFLVGIIYWTCEVWWGAAKDWVLEINHFKKVPK